MLQPEPPKPPAATGQGRGTVSGPLQTLKTLMSTWVWREELQSYDLKVHRPLSRTQGRQEKGECRGGGVVQWL